MWLIRPNADGAVNLEKCGELLIVDASDESDSEDTRRHPQIHICAGNARQSLCVRHTREGAQSLIASIMHDYETGCKTFQLPANDTTKPVPQPEPAAAPDVPADEMPPGSIGAVIAAATDAAKEQTSDVEQL